MRVSLLGVEFHSGNRGCGALAYSICEILREIGAERNEAVEIDCITFDDKPAAFIGDYSNVTTRYVRIKPKKLSFWRTCKKWFKESDFVLDFSMGDSFSDIYGNKRFLIASALKELAIANNKVFIMAPQTLGPFDQKIPKAIAKHILKKSAYLFTRDEKSLQFCRELIGKDPILTTDVAFKLPYEKMTRESKGKIVIGLNPSGLLWSGTKQFAVDKHLSVDYQSYIRQIMAHWCNDERYEVHLISHVFPSDKAKVLSQEEHEKSNFYEDDMWVCQEIQKEFPNVYIEEGYTTPMEIKSIISSLDVFSGARMHATIGAFSSGVATIPFSYSRKFEGLYGDLQYPYLINATSITTQEAVEKTIAWVDQYQILKKQVEQSATLVPEKQDMFINALMEVMKHKK